MSNPSGRRGAAWEKQVAEYLAANGFPAAERRAKEGRLDRGDIAGIANFVGECKAEKVIDLPGYLRELAVEQGNAEADFGAVFIKKRGGHVHDGYFVLSIEEGVAWMRALLLGEGR